MRIIMHVDMDYFFAAIEERENPELKNKPVIVGSDPKGGAGRGVVSTSNYLAREYGIKSGMPISKAWKLCPDGVYLPVNGRLYWKISENIMQILRNFVDKFEQTSVDEAYLDISDKVKDYKETETLTKKIKKEIFEKERLTCSIGIGPNKLIAKIASNYKKPNGLTVVEEKDVKKFLSPLPVGELLGVGRKTEPILLEMGIKTIGDLANYPIKKLIDAFGVWGYEFHKLANGIDNREVVEEWEPKSIGREQTFEEDINDTKIIFEQIDNICHEINREVLEDNYFFKTVTVKVRYEDFETHTKAKSLQFPTNRIKDMRNIAQDLILPLLFNGKKIRLVGVRVSNLISSKEQKTLTNVSQLKQKM